MNDPEDIQDAEFEEITTDKKLSSGNFLKSIAEMLASGNITPAQAHQFRTSLGITQARFTRKTLSHAERKTRRKVQAASRRANRGNGRGHKKSGRV